MPAQLLCRPRARTRTKPSAHDCSTQGTEFLAQASESAPADQMVHFNYGYALFLAGKYAEAAEHFRPVITADQQDGQAYFLFRKVTREDRKD